MMFFYGIEQLFLEEIGSGLRGRGIALAVFSVTMLVSNIPAGAISDIWGRVRSLKLAMAMLAIGLTGLSLSQNITHYSVAVVFFALYWSFDEGAKEAFVYDLLKDEGQSKRYQKILGRIYACLLLGAATANFASGFIAEATSLRTNYGLSLLSCFAALFFVLKLDEPEHHKQTGTKIMRQLADAVAAIKLSYVLLAVIISQTMIYVIATVSGEFAQPAILEHTDSALLLGSAWGVMGLFMAVANLAAHRVKYVLWFLASLLAAVAAFYILRSSLHSLWFLFFYVAGFEVISIKGEGALQENAPSNLRATISSIPGSLSMLIVAIVAIWVGGASGAVAVRIAAVTLPLMIGIFVIWAGIRKHIPTN